MTEKTINWDDPVAPPTSPQDAPAAVSPPPAPPAPSTGAVPDWALLPDGLRPPRGRILFFMRFPAAWTDTPGMGAPLPGDDDETASLAFGVPVGSLWRQCIVWALSGGDVKIALARAQGDNNRYSEELAKQMIRSVDGYVVDATGAPTPGSLELWWERVGGRVRGELTRFCVRIHSLSAEERRAFFEHGVASRAAG